MQWLDAQTAGESGLPYPPGAHATFILAWMAPRGALKALPVKFASVGGSAFWPRLSQIPSRALTHKKDDRCHSAYT